MTAQTGICGMKAVATIGGVDVSAQSLCEAHYAMRNGLAALLSPIVPAASAVCQQPYKYGGSSTGGAGAGLPYGGGVDQGQAGIWVPSNAPQVSSANFTQVLGTNFIRFVCPKSMTITKISFPLTAAAGANDAIDIGICSKDGTILLGSTGSQLGILNGALGDKVVNLQAPVNLVAGNVYYVCMAMPTPGGTAATISSVALITQNLSTMFGSTLGVIEQARLNTPAGPPLVAPFGAVVHVANGPIVALMQ